LAEHGTLEAYARFLLDGRAKYALDTEDYAKLRSIVADLLAATLEKLDFYQPHSQPRTPDYGHAFYGSVPQVRSSPALSFIKSCLDSDNLPLAVAALDKLLDMKNQTEEVARIRGIDVLLPLLPLLHNELQSRSPTPPLSLKQLSRLAVQLSLESIGAKAWGLSKQETQAILQAVNLGGDVDLLHSVYVS
jgi:hypothetical protein